MTKKLKFFEILDDFSKACNRNLEQLGFSFDPDKAKETFRQISGQVWSDNFLAYWLQTSQFLVYAYDAGKTGKPLQELFPFLIPVGKTLRELRVAAKLSQTELAKKIGVDQSTVCLWETGKTAPRLSMFKALAAALDCTEYDVLEAVRRSKHAN